MPESKYSYDSLVAEYLNLNRDFQTALRRPMSQWDSSHQQVLYNQMMHITNKLKESRVSASSPIEESWLCNLESAGSGSSQ